MRLSEVKVLLLGLTNRCNGKCIMCWHSNKSKHPVLDLPLPIYEHVKESTFRRIKVLNLAGGGEILLYPHIDKVLDDISQYKFRTMVTSNFSQISDYYRERFKNLDVEFTVSLDGSSKELQERIRPNCDYDKVLSNIKYFKQHGKRITVQTTVSNLNFYDMENMIALAGRLGVDTIKFQSVQYLGNLDQPYKMKKPDADIGYVTRVASIKTSAKVSIFLGFYNKPLFEVPAAFSRFYRLFLARYNRYCPNTLNSIKVQENGQVLSCCAPYSRVMGDLSKSSLEDILGTRAYDFMRLRCACPIRKSITGA